MQFNGVDIGGKEVRPCNVKLQGDEFLASKYIGRAMVELGKLKHSMSFNKLMQLSDKIEFIDSYTYKEGDALKETFRVLIEIESIKGLADIDQVTITVDKKESRPSVIGGKCRVLGYAIEALTDENEYIESDWDYYAWQIKTPSRLIWPEGQIYDQKEGFETYEWSSIPDSDLKGGDFPYYGTKVFDAIETSKMKFVCVHKKLKYTSYTPYVKPTITIGHGVTLTGNYQDLGQTSGPFLYGYTVPTGGSFTLIQSVMYNLYTPVIAGTPLFAANALSQATVDYVYPIAVDTINQYHIAVNDYLSTLPRKEENYIESFIYNSSNDKGFVSYTGIEFETNIQLTRLKAPDPEVDLYGDNELRHYYAATAFCMPSRIEKKKFEIKFNDDEYANYGSSFVVGSLGANSTAGIYSIFDAVTESVQPTRSSHNEIEGAKETFGIDVIPENGIHHIYGQYSANNGDLVTGTPPDLTIYVLIDFYEQGMKRLKIKKPSRDLPSDKLDITIQLVEFPDLKSWDQVYSIKEWV